MDQQIGLGLHKESRFTRPQPWLVGVVVYSKCAIWAAIYSPARCGRLTAKERS
jgi:hypothetical protein